MAELKTIKTKVSASAYIDSLPEQQKKDGKQLLKIFKEATGMRPAMWGESIVGYGSYHYVYASGREGDWPITGFSPRKQKLSIYIMPGVTKYPELLKKLGPYKNGSSCLYIKNLEDIDTKILEKIIKQSVKDMKKMYPKT